VHASPEPIYRWFGFFGMNCRSLVQH
jgi:hypothetical protein